MQIFSDEQRKNTENELEKIYNERLEKVEKNTKQFLKQRRFKRLIISNEYIYIFFVIQNGSEYLQMPLIENVPDDVTIIRVDYDIRFDGFSFILSHPSFESIPQYADIPIIEIENTIMFRNSKYKKIEG
jgi:hypothetical protein